MSYYEQPKTVTVNGKTFRLTPQDKEETLRSSAPTPKFLVDDKGHLINRKQQVTGEGGDGFNAQASTSFAQKPRECGSYGFSFTPVGYNDYTVRPNVILNGVRPGMNNTNPSAFHYLHKEENNQTKANTYLGMYQQQ